MAGVSFNNMRHVFPKKQVTNPATLLWGGTSINEVTQQKNRPTLLPSAIYFIFEMVRSIKPPRAPNPAPDGIWPRFKGYEDRSGRPKQTVLGVVPTQPA
jgi:hypothetical protein